MIKMSIKLVDMKLNYIGASEKWEQFIQLWSTKRIELNLDGNNFEYTPQSTD